MPRAPRILVAEGVYHLTTRGCADRKIFLDDTDRTTFESIVNRVVRKHSWQCGSICLMSTHYHLLVVTPFGDLDAGMHRVNGDYAQTFNRRHGFRGHVFQSRYQSEFVQTERHLLEVTRYIALNPVRAGLCRRPSEWPWSSYLETIGGCNPRPYVTPGVVLDVFADDLDLARSRFQAFVEDASLDRRP